MPFTASHTALVLPFVKRSIFSASGLIIGSMIPDFEFFLRMESHGPYMHSWLGILYLNIPLAVAFLMMYHNWVRNPMIMALPHYFEKRFSVFLTFDWNEYVKRNGFKIVYSIVFGNLTHLFWDAFTHFDGFFVERMPFFEEMYWGIPLYHILQYVCSALGAIFILAFIAKMPLISIDKKWSSVQKVGYWAIVGTCSAIVLLIRFWPLNHIEFDHFIVCSIMAFMIGLFVSSLLFRYLFYSVKQ